MTAVTLRETSGQPQRRGVLAPLRRTHVHALELPDSVAAHGVREGIGQLLAVPCGEQWSWAALLEVAPGDVRVAGVGGFLWLSPHWCWAALVPAVWLRPLQWRPFFPLIFERLDLAHRAGARLIETDVYGPWSAGHRLILALGFQFERVKRGHDGGRELWLTYARHRHVPELPSPVDKYRRLQHIEILRHLCPEMIGPALATDLSSAVPGGEVA